MKLIMRILPKVIRQRIEQHFDDDLAADVYDWMSETSTSYFHYIREIQDSFNLEEERAKRILDKLADTGLVIKKLFDNDYGNDKFPMYRIRKFEEFTFPEIKE